MIKKNIMNHDFAFKIACGHFNQNDGNWQQIRIEFGDKFDRILDQKLDWNNQFNQLFPF
jgi:hypothetical protein